MKDDTMALCLHLFLGGTIDIYKFKGYIEKFYKEIDFITVDDILLLKINIEKGKVDIGENTLDFKCYFILNTSGIGLLIFEFSKIIDEAIEDIENFLFKNYSFKIKEKEEERSFYSQAIDFFLNIFKLKNIREASSLHGLPDIKNEVKNKSGINFITYGKGKIIPGFSGNFILFFRKPEEITEDINEFVIGDNKFHLKNRNKFYITDDKTKHKIFLYIIIMGFYHRYLGISTKFIEDLKNDIRNLKKGRKTEKAVSWEWEREELEHKRLNFLDFLSIYKQRESWFSTINISRKLMQKMSITNIKNNLAENLETMEFMMGEISDLVSEKQTETFNYRTRRLEYLITILGGLGGVAAILAAIFGGNISTNIRVLAVLLIILIPAGIVFFEYFIRKRIKKSSHEAYINARINDLENEKQEYVRTLKTLKEEKEINSSSKAEILQLYENLIEDIKIQIEELQKEFR